MISSFFSLYRYLLGPALRALGGPGQECKFHPSCSVYAEQAFRELSFFEAIHISTVRIFRCNPWSRS